MEMTFRSFLNVLKCLKHQTVNVAEFLLLRYEKQEKTIKEMKASNKSKAKAEEEMKNKLGKKADKEKKMGKGGKNRGQDDDEDSGKWKPLNSQLSKNAFFRASRDLCAYFVKVSASLNHVMRLKSASIRPFSFV